MRFDERGEALDALGERCDGLLEREDVDGRWAARLIGVIEGGGEEGSGGTGVAAGADWLALALSEAMGVAAAAV